MGERTVIKPVISIGPFELKTALADMLASPKVSIGKLRQEDVRVRISAMIERGGKQLVKAWWYNKQEQVGAGAIAILHELTEAVYMRLFTDCGELWHSLEDLHIIKFRFQEAIK